MELYFVAGKLPRTIKREEWYEIHRWRRKTIKELRKAMDEKLKHALLFGDTPHEKRMKQDILDEAIFPPLLLGPYMDMK